MNSGMNKEFFDALDQLESDRGISKTYMLEKVEAALQAAFKKENAGQSNVRIAIDPEKKVVKVLKQFEVVQTVEDPETQISLEDAMKISRRLSEGDVAEIEQKTKAFGRISAQAAKMVIIQGIREAEKNKMIQEYEDKKDDILSGRVILINPKTGNAMLDINHRQATLIKSEQIPGEILRPGQYVKVYVVDIKKDTKGPTVMLSRTHTGLVKRLFELEVPEIEDGTVIIHSISREAGSRTKIAVYSRNPDVDPIGACIGVKGMRKNNIIDELSGEKLDIIQYSESPQEFIKAALSPATVLEVTLESDSAEKAERVCRVMVAPDQLSLAIGKEGQNARLAARLTGYKIDIKA